MSATVRVVLCVGAGQSVGDFLPDVAGDDEHGAPWLQVMSCAREAREALAGLEQLEEVWVASSDDVEAINLAAALKADCPDRKVYLVGCDETGSVRSRMHAAALDGALSARDLAQRFAEREAGGVDAHGGDNGQDIAGTAAQEGSCWVADALPERESEREAAKPSLPAAPSAPLPDAAHAGFLLTVVSGSGGAGKSTVATLAARLACRRGLRTALLDADLQFGDLREIAGACANVSIEDVAADAHALDGLSDETLVLVTAPARLETAEVVGASLDEVIDALLGRFDFVAVNTGGGWDEQRVRLLERSVSALFLVDQRASSVRACRHALDLCLRCGVATSSFLLAVNRCTRHASFTSIDVSSALHGAHVVELSDGGREVEELLGAGLADALIGSGNPLCASIDRLLDEILPASKRASHRDGGQMRTIARLGLGGEPRREGSRRRGRREGGRRRRREAKRPATSEATI